MLLNVATPATAVTVTVPPKVAPPGFAPNARVTGPVNVVAMLPLLSSAVMTNGASAAPDEPFDGCVVTTSFDATAACARAVKVSGEFVSVPAEAVADCVPAVGPSVHEVCASPLASETTLAFATLPAPVATAKFTVTPETPTPSPAATFTTSGCASCVPTLPVCPLPPCAMICDAGKVMLSITVSAGPVRSCATMRALPRWIPANPVPAVTAVTLATVGSSDVQMIGVLGIACPELSLATAENANGDPDGTVVPRGAMTTVAAL